MTIQDCRIWFAGWLPFVLFGWGLFGDLVLFLCFAAVCSYLYEVWRHGLHGFTPNCKLFDSENVVGWGTGMWQELYLINVFTSNTHLTLSWQCFRYLRYLRWAADAAA